MTPNRLPALALCLLAIGAAAGARATPVHPTPAPSWKLMDVNGTPVSSDQFKGKVVVVDFWATWCPPCRAEIPGYVDLQKKYAKDGLVIVGVSLDQKPPGEVRKFMERFGINYTIVMGTPVMQDSFGEMDGIPTTFIIDRRGNIRDRKVGSMPEEEFESVLLTYLKPQ